jgi:hypothetical protein
MANNCFEFYQKIPFEWSPVQFGWLVCNGWDGYTSYDWVIGTSHTFSISLPKLNGSIGWIGMPSVSLSFDLTVVSVVIYGISKPCWMEHFWGAISTGHWMPCPSLLAMSQYSKLNKVKFRSMIGMFFIRSSFDWDMNQNTSMSTSCDPALNIHCPRLINSQVRDVIRMSSEVFQRFPDRAMVYMHVRPHDPHISYDAKNNDCIPYQHGL